MGGIDLANVRTYPQLPKLREHGAHAALQLSIATILFLLAPPAFPLRKHRPSSRSSSANV